MQKKRAWWLVPAIACIGVVATAIVAGAAGNARNQSRSPRPLTIDDVFAVRDIGEIQVSPDGATVIFTLTTQDAAANRSTTRLLRVRSAGGAPEEVTGVPAGASHVRWSPDGSRLAFFVARVNGPPHSSFLVPPLRSMSVHPPGPQRQIEAERHGKEDAERQPRDARLADERDRRVTDEHGSTLQEGSRPFWAAT